MKGRYKLILSSKNLYKEIELSPDILELRVGTSLECTVRLRKELFFSPIELNLQKTDDGWQLLCSDNIYFTVGDVRKLLTKKLVHGDELFIKYQDSDNDVFSLSFVIDFEYENKDYDIEIDIKGQSQVKIGGSDGQIRFTDQFLGNDSMVLSIVNGRAVIHDNQSKYGVFVNGAKINKSAEIKDFDFFSIVGFSFYYRSGKLYTSSDSTMKINGLNSRKVEIHSTHFKYPKFNRNSRVQYVIPEENLEIQQAVQKPSKPKKSIVMSLIPSIVMLAMTIVLRGIIGGGSSFVIYSAVSMGIGIVMSIVSFAKESKDYKKEWQERIDAYNSYIEDKRKVIEESRANELRIRNLIYESLENSIHEVNSFGKRLFERTQEDKDFLQIYLGRGRVESSNPVIYNKQEFADLEDPLAKVPEEVAESYRYIENAPIISDMNVSCGIGVVGSKTILEQILKNMTLDISIRHFYNEVKMVYILSDDYVDRMRWVRWLHNVENYRLDVKNIVCDVESKNVILEDLYITLSMRENALAASKEVKFNEQYVVFVTDAASISTHPVSKYIKECAQYGFTFVFLEEYEEFLPQGCTEIIRIQDTANGCILKSENGDVVSNFVFPTVSDEVAESVALKLGAITVDEVSLEGELTKNITMFEMLGILSVEDMDLNERWSSSVVYRSLAAPIGVKTKNQIVHLDISDKSGAHGPHGLVAGTTGSGKSEVLQTYILSMATLFHPYEVGFVIIDFKGGGMANQFKNLPHLIGTITNIDGREISRSLLSIKAELVKRQEMFSESGVNHINDYIKLYKAGKVSKPMPHLIMIVDEFAELKQEYPDFMKELISAARIGRTLGIHLILATQKPAGVVDAQIWSNSKFKLCLKVQTKEDSNEVIKTPLAAEIVEPGRAYFQVGNNEIFDLFQSAYSGANVPEGNENNEKTFAIYERNLWGKKTLKYTNKKSKSSKSSVTQLQAIVDYVNDYCGSKGIDKLPGICLPSLKDNISTDELNYSISENAGIVVPVGFYDDPEQQDQGTVDLDIAKDNVYIVGSAQMGKTVFLQTLVYGLLKKYTPQQVNVYLVDCGSMVLKIFENSAHVGGVVLSNEEEKCKNLFKLLNGMVIQRKKTLSSKGVGNYAAYLEAGFTDMPMAVVVIDNMAAFKEYFPDQADDINSLAREAQGVGISFVVTAATSNSLNYRTQANFGRKIVLNCNDTNEYSAMFGHCKETPKENAGRGLFTKEKRILEFQVAMFGKSEKEADRSQELKKFIFARNAECTGKAVEIPMIPDKLSLMYEMKENAAAFRNREILPIGMDFETVALTSVNLANTGSLALLGEAESKEVFISNFMSMISHTAVFHNIEAYVVDDKSKKLKACDNYGFVRHYTSDAADGITIIDDFCDDVSHRLDNEDRGDSYIMLVVNSADVFKRVCADKTLSKHLAETLKSANDAGAFIVFTTIENQPVGFNSSEILKVLKEERQAILFAQLSESKMFDISGRVKSDASFDNTMGYRFNGSSYSKIKIFD